MPAIPDAKRKENNYLRLLHGLEEHHLPVLEQTYSRSNPDPKDKDFGSLPILRITATAASAIPFYHSIVLLLPPVYLFLIVSFNLLFLPAKFCGIAEFTKFVSSISGLFSHCPEQRSNPYRACALAGKSVAQKYRCLSIYEVVIRTLPARGFRPLVRVVGPRQMAPDRRHVREERQPDTGHPRLTGQGHGRDQAEG